MFSIAGVTSRQEMLTPLMHLITPLLSADTYICPTTNCVLYIRTMRYRSFSSTFHYVFEVKNVLNVITIQRQRIQSRVQATRTPNKAKVG
jgi:hypothetical protein